MRRRNSLRLKNYNYTLPGEYFITFNTWQKKHILGKIIKGKMELNDYGRMVKLTWLDLKNHNPNIILDEFIIMPNHFHGIIIIKQQNGRIPNPPNNGRNRVPPQQSHGLSEIIRQLKAYSTKRINILRRSPGKPVWHRGFNDKIIWTEEQLSNTQRYIKNNPKNWGKAKKYKARFKT